MQFMAGYSVYFQQCYHTSGSHQGLGYRSLHRYHIVDPGLRHGAAPQDHPPAAGGRHLVVRYEESVHRHGHAAARHPRRQPLADTGQLPETTQQTRLVPEQEDLEVRKTDAGAGPVEDAGPEGADVGAGADAEEDDGEQTLEVEERRHGFCKLLG